MFRRLFKSLTRRQKREQLPLFGDRRVHLHLGAHKTATTFIQNILRDNKETLLEQGVLYLTLDQTRKELTRPLVALCSAHRDRDKLETHRHKLLDIVGRDRLARCHTVLISDENLAGRAGGGSSPRRIKRGLPYGSIAGNWKHARAELGPNITAFYSIREYCGFMTSTYSEIFRRFPKVPFKKLRTWLEESPALWSMVHRDLSAAFGGENVVLWDFTDTVAHPAEVLAMLTGVEAPLAIRTIPSRESFSKRAMEFVREFHKLPGPPLPGPVITEVARRLYPLATHPAKFDPWTEAEKTALREIYLKEKDILRPRAF